MKDPQVVFLRQAHKYIKKASPALKNKIKQEVLDIQKDPYSGKKLTGKLKELFSHKFIYRRTHYRIAYTIENNLIIICIASRENFYRDLLN